MDNYVTSCNYYSFKKSRNIAALVLTAALALGNAALAGSTHQGSTHQGSTHQGSTHQGSTHQGAGLQAGWLEGETLLGAIVDDLTGQTALIEVLDFRGHYVDALIHSGPNASPQPIALPPAELVGMQWSSAVCASESDCVDLSFRIVSVVQDDSQTTMPAHPDNSDVWLYEIQYEESGSGDWHDACSAAGDHGGRGLFVNGRWNNDGSFDPAGYTFSCTAGVIAKCTRAWGYKPWKTLRSADNRDIDLAPLHQACTRAARADYCGDGISHTYDGTLIDMFDRYGFNVSENLPQMLDESTFGESGSHWVELPRWDTATPIGGGWDFGTCQRADSPAPGGQEPLIYVRSETLIGNQTPAP